MGERAQRGEESSTVEETVLVEGPSEPEEFPVHPPLDKEAAGFSAWEAEQQYLSARIARRKFYQEHPASAIPPVVRPVLLDLENLPPLVEIGELVLMVKLDPCQTWAAHLVRKAYVGKLPAGASPYGPGESTAHALFEAKVSGGVSKVAAIEAVLAAAQRAGWMR